ncbi:MAG: MBL fold metallo-hydrolase [Deltaproteobacteria bacterium]|nr:MBL fold metallo-hydrolase [Deltaproteobacteria bacterium]
MSTTPHWPKILPFLLAPRARQRNDVSAAEQFNWSHFAPMLPTGLSITWLGTAGFLLQYQGASIVIDPYLSRAPIGKVATRRPLLPDPQLVDRLLPRVDAVLVGHTHFDHAVDVPYIAQRDRAIVYGSSSSLQLLALHGAEDLAAVPEFYRVYAIGPFEVSFVPSVHSKLVLGLKVPYEGELTCDHAEGLTSAAYRCGQVYGIHISVAGISFYHQGSCNLIDDAVRHRDIDFFLAGIAGRGFTERYWQRILSRLEPRVIVPHHHDNFFLPLEGRMGFSFNVNFGGFVEEIAAISKDFAIRCLRPLQTVCGR